MAEQAGHPALYSGPNMKWYTRSCERPLNRSARDAVPSSVSNRYSLSMRTQGSSCRCCASSSPRRVSAFSASSSSSRAASHSSRVPILWSGMVSPLLLRCHIDGEVGVASLTTSALSPSCVDAAELTQDVGPSLVMRGLCFFVRKPNLMDLDHGRTRERLEG